MNEPYDIIISGAGIAGLSTAIFCARNEHRVLVLEKQSGTGTFPRGETVRPDPIIDELLGSSFMDRICLHRTAKRRYWSPGGSKHFSLEREQASYLFHWNDLTAGLQAAAENAGADIRFDSEVTAPRIETGRCVGVELTDGTRYAAGTVVAADGHTSPLGRFCSVDYERLNCPIAKRICSGITTDYDGMEYFFIPTGSLDSAPSFPPCIAFIFPRGNGHAEVGLLLLTGALPPRKRRLIPNRSVILRVLQGLTESYPVFSDRVAGAAVTFEGVTSIPMAGLHTPVSTIPGLILAGDAIGLVEASGGCGIVAAMKNAAFIAAFLNTAPRPWGRQSMTELNTAFRQSDIFRHIRKKYRKLLPVTRLLFGKNRPASHFEHLWALLGFIFKKV